ncbi:uncharacterized protein crybg2 [Menidia menidia]
MAKKSSSRKTLKTFFSRSSAAADQPAHEEEESRRFKLPKLKIKWRNAPASEMLDTGGRPVHRSESGLPPEDGEAAPSRLDRKPFSVHGSRVKDKEFSYSELDLRKPKKFSSFSFGLRKRKKREEGNMSKSSFGLDESTAHLRALDQSPVTPFSMSQPELDTSGVFDIPSPPAVASPQPESCWGLLSAPPRRPEGGPPRAPEGELPRAPEGDPLRVPEGEPLRAPIASIPELQLEEGQSDPTQTTQPDTVPADPPMDSTPPPKEAPAPPMDRAAPQTGSRLSQGAVEVLPRSLFPQGPPSGTSLRPPLVEPPGSHPAAPPGGNPGGTAPPAAPSELKSSPAHDAFRAPPASVPGAGAQVSAGRPVSGGEAAGRAMAGGEAAGWTPAMAVSERPLSPAPLSPAPLSPGSEDGSFMEVYYSAQEDNGEDSEAEGPVRGGGGGGDRGGDMAGWGGALGLQQGNNSSKQEVQQSAAHPGGQKPEQGGGEEQASTEQVGGGSGGVEQASTELGGGGSGFTGPTSSAGVQECDAAPPTGELRGEESRENPTPPTAACQHGGAVSSRPRSPAAEGGGCREEEPTKGEGEGAGFGPTACEGSAEGAGFTPTACEGIAEGAGFGPTTREGSAEGAGFGPTTREGSAERAGFNPTAREGSTVSPGAAVAPQQPPADPSDPSAATRRPAEPPPHLRTQPAATSQPRMSSEYRSRLAVRSPSLPEESDSKLRVHKLSLTAAGNGEPPPDPDPDQMDPGQPEPDPGALYRWKNRFEGLSQYRAASLSSPGAEPLSPVSLSRDAAEGRGLPGQAGGAGGGEAEPEQIKAGGAPPPPSVSRSSPEDEETRFTGVFKATLVQLDPEHAAPPSSPPASPEAESPYSLDMNALVDTLKSLPSLKPRSSGLRVPPPALVSSLPPIVEDAPSSAAPQLPPPVSGLDVADAPNGLYTLPADLGLKRSASRDSRPPLQLMRNDKELSGLTQNGGSLPPPPTSSRLDSSVLFSSYRSADQAADPGKAHRPLFRASSLPERPPSDRLAGPREQQGEGEPAGSRFERLSFLLNSPSSSSLPGSDDSSRMSRAPALSLGSPPTHSPTHLLSPAGHGDLHWPFASESPTALFGQGPGAGGGPLLLQRSLSCDGAPMSSPQGPRVQSSLLSNTNGGPQFQSQLQEPDRNLISKYRAFPDAYLTKEKEHGKLNPRPGKMYIFDRPGMCGQRIEVRGDVIDATPWELQDTISIRVVRGGWVLYEKPNFKGEKVALEEGDIELTCPFSPPEDLLPNGQKEGEEEEEEGTEQVETKPARKFIIGSVRRAVRDYSVPDISLFPEENAEGKKVVFRDTSEDARIFGFPIKANSIIINAGLWLVFSQPFFQGVPRVLEVGGYSTPAAWGVEQPYVASLHPLKVGEPRVENTSEPQMVIYDKPYFTGKSRTISSNMKDFMTRTHSQQSVFMHSVGSLKVQGGIWVGYQKEGFRGHQYLLEEGEYHDWRVWGGCDSELRSARLIQADLTDPVMVMFEQPEEEEEGMLEENTFEVTEAIPDVELFGYKTSTRSIHVLSGVWIAYSHVDFSGDQYVLEKGLYHNCADWGSQGTRICSVQPVLLAPLDSARNRQEIILYSEPGFHGESLIFDQNQEALETKFLSRSCRVVGGSWVLFDDLHFSGNMFVLSEGSYPSLTSMGCPPSCSIRSVRPVQLMFSVPSISLFGLEGLEGREITADGEVLSLVQEGFNSHVLSVRVNSGCWVLCEHTNYRGRQFLLEPIEITNWPKFSSLDSIGSMYPVRQKRHFFNVRNMESGHLLSVQGGVEEMKSGRVVAAAEVEPLSDIWFYQDGLIKNKASPTMSLQVIGNLEPAAKVVLWTETRQPIQTWTAQMQGLIRSLVFSGMVLDVKGGKAYDRDHVVVMPEDEERPSQRWQLELL